MTAEQADRPQAKRTAESVAALRFLGSFEPDAAVRNPDQLSGEFINPRFRRMARTRPLRAMLRGFVRRRFPGAIEYQIVRTRHLDGIVLQALENGVAQLVILGAGYDTRPYRFRDRLGDVKVVEVDYPATLARKQDLVIRAFGILPDHVQYVPIDFNEESLASKLRGGTYEGERRTLFLWEGVSMFVGAEAVDRTLGFVADYTVSGSSIVFDYVVRAAIVRPADFEGAEQAARRFEKSGEPWTFGLDPESVDEFLSERGLQLLSHYRREDLEDAYLRGSDGELIGHTHDFNAIVHAGVRREVDPDPPRSFPRWTVI